jgi:hypothetical protein
VAIPDASKLNQEKGMFWYAEGAENADDEGGYTFWIDELKFEKLGTIAQPRPQMLSGEDVVEQTFTSSTIQITGLTQTFNLGSGVNQTVAAAPSYFTFSSSNVEVAQVSELGIVSVLGTGTAEITAILNGVLASGSLTVTSTGAIENSPIPTQLAADVKSVFSDTYINAVESNFDPRFGGSTTQASLIASNSNSYQAYTDNNFTGIIFESNLDATDLTTFHIDVYTQDASSSTVSFQIRDIGANGVIDSDNDGNPIEDDKDLRFDASGLQVGQWVSFDIPLTGNIATQKDNLGAIILVGGTSFILDNIYFYK